MNPTREPANEPDSAPRAKRTARSRRQEETAHAATPPAFEEALARLEEIVAQLEGGQLPLDQALSLYEEGVRLYHACETILNSASLRLERLRIGDAADGTTGAANDEQDEMFFVETFELDER